MVKDWRNRDYKWIIAILVGIIVLILSLKLNKDDNVVNIITLLSSGSSIGLAMIAIVQSTIYNTSSNDLYSRMSEKLNALENGVDTIKASVLKDVKEAIDDSTIGEDEKEELKHKLVDIINSDERNINNNERNINNVKAGYLTELLVQIKLREIYSQNNNYDIYNDYTLTNKYLNNRKMIIDILIEKKDKSQSILIDVKRISKCSDALLKNIAHRFKMLVNTYTEEKGVKTVIPVLLIIHNKKTLYPNEFEGIKIIQFTEEEISNINKNQWNKALGIEP